MAVEGKFPQPHAAIRRSIALEGKGRRSRKDIDHKYLKPGSAVLPIQSMCSKTSNDKIVLTNLSSIEISKPRLLHICGYVRTRWLLKLLWD